MIKLHENLFNLSEPFTGYSPLHVSIREDKPEYIKLMIFRSDIKDIINSQNNILNFAPIHFASLTGNIQILSMLLLFKLDLSPKCKIGQSPIHISASNSNIKFIEELLEFGVDINEKDSGNYTALHHAVCENSLETVEFLVKKGASLTGSDEIGRTPFLLAIVYDNLEAVEFLYKYKEGLVGTCQFKGVHLACLLQDSRILEFLHAQGESLLEGDKSVRMI